MNTGESLLAEIVKPENRADDTLRLAYADWLDENDQPERAEFIRVQIELAAFPDSDCTCPQPRNPPHTCERCCRLKALRRREQELLDAAAVEDWAALPACAALQWQYTRGFVSRVRAEWTGWRDHADAILAAHPVEKVVLTTWPADLELVPASHADDRGVTHALSLRWPDIEFELPPPGWRNYVDQYTDLTREQMIAQLRRAAGHMRPTHEAV